MENRIVTVSPSSFAFLVEECPKCYYLETLKVRKRPRTPFPAIFTAIDLAMKRHFESAVWHTVARNEKRFRIENQGKWVESAPYHVPGTDLALVIRGVYDSCVLFEDGTRAICDFKTSPVRPELATKYSRQLHAYAWALENPAHGEPLEVHSMGLAVFEPQFFAANETDGGILRGNLSWIEILRDREFETFLGTTGTLLAGNEPASSPGCTFCAYHEAA